MSQPWEWDPNRREYFYYSPTERAWIYQHGTRLIQTTQDTETNDSQTTPRRASINNGQQAPQSQYPQQYQQRRSSSSRGSQDYIHNLESLPRDFGSISVSEGYQGLSVSAYQNTQQAYSGQSQQGSGQSLSYAPGAHNTYGSATYGQSPYNPAAFGRNPSVQYSSSQPNQTMYAPAPQVHTQATGTGYGYAQYGPQMSPYSSSGTAYSQQPQWTYPPDHIESQPSSLLRGPSDQITETSLQAKGVQAHARVPGTAGKVEKLDPRFKIRSNPRDFFRRGKVFKVLWPEMLGNSNERTTVVTMDSKFDGEEICLKTRWFVVIKAGMLCCSCLPIQTYSGRGTAKPGVQKWCHAIIFTGEEEPEPNPEELPGKNEYGMLPPIRVRPRSTGDSLHAMSRINFENIYTVQHNVKVFEFGNVHPRYRRLLKENWRWVWARKSPYEIDDSSDDNDDGDSPDEKRNNESPNGKRDNKSPDGKRDNKGRAKRKG